ncbi:ribosomal protein L22(archaeal)/L17(eukaryotic/archaeal) [Thermoplasmatales archaeon BRNA1]|nr:ribosomal protein L22(archaeal)/L17(eukaryotic/archaeal) [Thermoplasmatales archaeon BRNA1]
MATNKGYTVVADPDTTAKALSKEQPISPKLAREVACMVRGMTVSDARTALEEVIDKERPVRMNRYNKRVAHKPGVGPGKYPVKVSKAVLACLESAASNADYKGLDSASMKITTISVARGRVIPGHRPRAQGRATEWNQDTVNIEIVISEVE